MVIVVAVQWWWQCSDDDGGSAVVMVVAVPPWLTAAPSRSLRVHARTVGYSLDNHAIPHAWDSMVCQTVILGPSICPVGK